jgi:creatinine amidohydrolase
LVCSRNDRGNLWEQLKWGVTSTTPNYSANPNPANRLLAAAVAALLSLGFLPAWAAPERIFLDDLTSAEVRAAVKDGKTTVIIPVGGTEQSGPHIALGKHNIRVKALSGKVAEALGNALVAPVLAYVPEGNIDPASGHMRFAGTISVPEGAFKSIIEGAARSFRQHGFLNIVMVGDHGGYQPALKAVVASLNREWAKTPSNAARTHFIGEYYAATQTTYVKALRSKGLSDHQIGLHAGVADTALSMAVDPAMVRPDLFATAAQEGPAGGTVGDPKAATSVLGQLGVDAVVSETVQAIRRAVATPR